MIILKILNIYNSSNTHLSISLYGGLVEIKPKETIQIETDVLFGCDNFKIVSSDPNHEWKEAYMGRYNQNLILRQENEKPTFYMN